MRFSAAGPAVLAGAIAYNIIFALVPGGIVLVTAASFFISLSGSKERREFVREEALGFRKAISATLRRRSFRWFLYLPLMRVKIKKGSIPRKNSRALISLYVK